MNGKQYLQQAYRLNELIDSNIREIESLRLLSTGIAGSNFDERFSGGKVKNEANFANIVQKIIDLETEINEEIDAYIDMKVEVRRAIERIQDKDQQLILKLRYIEFMPWEQIAEKTGYSLRQVFRIHDEGLKHVTPCH